MRMPTFWADMLYGVEVLFLLHRRELRRNHFYAQTRGPIMWKNYVKVALRTMQRHKGYTFINVAGLASGIVCFMLILLYVQDERSYDRYHDNADRTYRVVEVMGDVEESASQPFLTGVTLVNDFPHLVESQVRFYNLKAPTVAMRYEAPTGEVRSFNERHFFFTDSTLFDVFNFTLVRGNPETVLDEPFTVILTQAVADRYFQGEDPLGKTLRLEMGHDVRVTGILDEVPFNSHFRPEVLVSFSTIEQIYAQDSPHMINIMNGWAWNPVWTYIVLREEVLPETLEALFPDFVEQYFHPAIKHMVSLYLQPLTDIHLHSQLDFEIEPNSNVAYVYIFSVVSLFVLLIACINFINLTTARSARRAPEVGMRKVLGARRKQLVGQFLGESLLTVALAILIAVPTTWLLVPALNTFTGKAMALNLFSNPLLSGSLLATLLGIGVVSGLYPAFYLSSFRPVRVLKGSTLIGHDRATHLFRKGLVVAQFTITITLLIGTWSVYDQLQYLRDTGLGFDDDAVLMAAVPRSGFTEQFPALKAAFLDNANVMAVSATQDVVGGKYDTCPFVLEGETEIRNIKCLRVHDDFVETMRMTMAAGRDFSDAFPNDPGNAVIINEAMAQAQGWATPEDALGQEIMVPKASGPEPAEVAGVVEDFHYASLHTPIEPFLLYRFSEGAFQTLGKYLVIRVRSQDMSATLAYLESQWDARVTDSPFDYFFLDDNLAQLYDGEATLSNVAGVFSLLAILIACLGLFGLAAFMAEQRTKEIGVRKVLGASASGIMLMLTGDFVKLVGLSFLLAAPFAYGVMTTWLQNFAYHTNLRPEIFILTGLLAFLIAVLTVSYKAVRIALTNPVDALRYE